MDKVEFCFKRLTTCSSGSHFNPLMHVFLLITLVLGLAILTGGTSVASMLYIETSQTVITILGFFATLSIVFHICGFLIRGRFGVQLMRLAMFTGFFVWLWIAATYLSVGYLFQFLFVAVPNIFFWSWYAWQWRKRYNHMDEPHLSVFVN